MSTIVLPLIFTFLSALVGALVTWMVARRRSSGKINTTEAETLWLEGQSMRADLRAEIVSLRDEVSSLRVELSSLRAEASILRTEADSAREALARCGTEVRRVRAQLAVARKGL